MDGVPGKEPSQPVNLGLVRLRALEMPFDGELESPEPARREPCNGRVFPVIQTPARVFERDMGLADRNGQSIVLRRV
jgi:hypothetical protein